MAAKVSKVTWLTAFAMIFLLSVFCLLFLWNGFGVALSYGKDRWCLSLLLVFEGCFSVGASFCLALPWIELPRGTIPARLRSTTCQLQRHVASNQDCILSGDRSARRLICFQSFSLLFNILGAQHAAICIILDLYIGRKAE